MVIVFWIAGYCVGCLVIVCFVFARQAGWLAGRGCFVSHYVGRLLPLGCWLLLYVYGCFWI